jgi:CspA family cold shock protein
VLGPLLNDYLVGMTDIVFAHDGTVAKIVGDALHVCSGRPASNRTMPCAPLSALWHTVKFYNEEKGFGFITPDGGGRDAFVHVSALRRAGLNSLTQGQRVSLHVLDEPGTKSSQPARGVGSALNFQVLRRSQSAMRSSTSLICCFSSPTHFSVMLSFRSSGRKCSASSAFRCATISSRRKRHHCNA